LSYAIGISDPVAIYVDTYGFYENGQPHGIRNIRSEDELIQLISETFRLRPGQIVDDFLLKRPNFSKISAYGHFGRNDVG